MLKSAPYLFFFSQTPAAAKADRAQPVPEPEEVVLYMGIIDILQVQRRTHKFHLFMVKIILISPRRAAIPQDFNARKLFERGFKSILHDSYAISVAPPKLYATRFYDFMSSNVSVKGGASSH